MWFRSVYLKTLRDFRIGIFGWGIGIGLLVFVVLLTVPSLITTPQARAAVVILAKSFTWVAEPIKVDTPGGYATWKYGPTILLIAIWAIAAGARVLRGEEERGTMDVLLSLPRSRGRVALAKVAAMATALLGMAVIITLLVYAGGRRVDTTFGFAAGALFSINLVLAAAVFGALAMLISQFTRERATASGMAGGLLVLSIVVDMVHRIFPNAEWVSQLSPVYYYNLSKPLVPGYSSNALGPIVLLALAVIFSGAAVWLFRTRDIGSPVPLPAWLRRPERAVPITQALPVADWSLRSVYARGLRTLAVPTFWWTLGIAGFGAWMAVIVKQTESLLSSLAASSPIIANLFKSESGSSLDTAIFSGLFFFLPVALMAYAVTQAHRFAADEEDGRLELLLATPQPRIRVLLGRFSALTTGTLAIALITLIATAVAAALGGLQLDLGNLAAASFSMVPLALLVAALGYLFAGWLRTAIDTGLLSFLLLAWFAITFLGPDLKFPDSVQRLSPLYYYGSPMIHGLAIANVLGILVIGAAALAIASLRFARKDIAV